MWNPPLLDLSILCGAPLIDLSIIFAFDVIIGIRF